MSQPRIYCFLKTFSENQHAQQFLDGSLYMNSLDYFIQLEDGDGSDRGDQHEAVSCWLQPQDIDIELNGMKINSADLAAPVFIRYDSQLKKRIFCMHASHVGGDAPAIFETPEDFEEQLKIPTKNISLGQYSVLITDVKEFLDRVKVAAVQKNFSLQAGLVRYYDSGVSHENFSENTITFRKQSRFSHQREYRITLD
ncbi:MAG: hypothetical protein WA154_12415, partial [Moraxellaceae bacterium]